MPSELQQKINKSLRYINKSVINVQLVALAVIKELIKAKFDSVWSRARCQNLKSKKERNLQILCHQLVFILKSRAIQTLK